MKTLFLLGLSLASTLVFAENYASPSGYLMLDRVDFEMSFLKKSCPNYQLVTPHLEKNWEVSEFKLIASSGAKKYYYQTCKGTDIPDELELKAPEDNVAAFLYEVTGNGHTMHLIWGDTVESTGVAWFGDAKTLTVGSGQLVVVANPTGATAGANDDQFFFLQSGKATMLDAASWQGTVAAHLPTGMSVSDAIANGTLTIQGNKLAVKADSANSKKQ